MPCRLTADARYNRRNLASPQRKISSIHPKRLTNTPRNYAVFRSESSIRFGESLVKPSKQWLSARFHERFRFRSKELRRVWRWNLGWEMWEDCSIAYWRWRSRRGRGPSPPRSLDCELTKVHPTQQISSFPKFDSPIQVWPLILDVVLWNVK